MHLSFIWEKEYSSSLPFASLSLYFSFITGHVSSPVSLDILHTSRFYFSALSLSAFPLFSSLSASSTLCCFHCLYEHLLNQTSLIKLADGGAFPSRGSLILTELISLLQLHSAIPNHNSYTLVDPLDVRDYLEQLGFAFKEISCREIKLILSDAAATRYFCLDCFGV